MSRTRSHEKLAMLRRPASLGMCVPFAEVEVVGVSPAYPHLGRSRCTFLSGGTSFILFSPLPEAAMWVVRAFDRPGMECKQDAASISFRSGLGPDRSTPKKLSPLENEPELRSIIFWVGAAGPINLRPVFFTPVTGNRFVRSAGLFTRTASVHSGRSFHNFKFRLIDPTSGCVSIPAAGLWPSHPLTVAMIVTDKCNTFWLVMPRRRSVPLRSAMPRSRVGRQNPKDSERLNFPDKATSGSAVFSFTLLAGNENVVVSYAGMLNNLHTGCVPNLGSSAFEHELYMKTSYPFPVGLSCHNGKTPKPLACSPFNHTIRFTVTDETFCQQSRPPHASLSFLFRSHHQTDAALRAYKPFHP